MIEIVFKAKRISNGEWVYGGYCQDLYTHRKYIVCHNELQPEENEFIEIDPKTLCQHTGFRDKNGEDIWENDIVELSGFDSFYTEDLAVVRRPIKQVYKAEWIKKYGQWFFSDYCKFGCPCYEMNENVSIIGNIFDNYELFNNEKHDQK